MIANFRAIAAVRVLASTASLLLSVTSIAAPQAAPASIAAKTSGFDRRDGFLPMYLDPRSGKLLLELPRDSARALLLISQATGLGSNPIGIDRGASDASHVVRFDRDGDRILALPENWKYRGDAATAAPT